MFETTMLTRNSGDLQKAQSNHWFFTYLPDSLSVYQNQNTAGNNGSMRDTGNGSGNSSATRNTVVDRYLPYSLYSAFCVAAVLALYTQVAVVHPAHSQWREVTTEAFGLQHVIEMNQHERLARKFHLIAHSDVIEGVKDRIKAAHGMHESRTDKANASAMLQIEKDDWSEVQEEKQDALEHAHKAAEEHELYEEYLQNATAYEEHAEKLEARAKVLANQSVEYQRLAMKFYWAARNDTVLEQEYMRNATRESQAANNITKAEEKREGGMLLCRWTWSRKYVCGALGGMTALGEAEALRRQEEEDYEKAVGVERQVLVERTIAMIAYVRAERAEHDAQLAHLRAVQSHNVSMQDKLKAAEEHALELEDLQKELEDMHMEHQNVKDLEYYQGMQVKLDKRARKENQYAHGQWELGTELLHDGEEAQKKANAEYDMAKQEATRQKELIEEVNFLGRRVRLYSSIAAAYALIALACFVMALTTTNTVSLGYHLKNTVLAAGRQWEGRGATWEGRSILGDSQSRSSIRQLSRWGHHVLFFLVAAAIQGDQLKEIFTNDSSRMRGEILLRFAVTAGVLETLLFQAIPHASILPTLTSEYVRNVVIRLFSSTLQFAIQMLLLLVLCGQDSEWLFDWIQFLGQTYLVWIIFLIGTSLTHFWFIEYPYALDASRQHGPMSDMTSLDMTFSTTSDSVYGGNNMIASRLLDEEKGSLGAPQQHFETESLLTVSRAEAPGSQSDDSAPYSSISLNSASVANTRNTEGASSFPPAALQRLYEVSIQDEFYGILAHVELVLLTGILLVVCASLPNIAARH